MSELVDRKSSMENLNSHKASKRRKSSIRSVLENITLFQSIKNQLTPKRIFILFIYLCVIIGCAIAIEQGVLDILGEFADDSGAFGVFVFFLAMFLIVQPYAWGYTPAVVVVGFLYGWLGLLIVLGGVISGTAVAFFTVRYFGERFCGNSLESLPPKQQLFLTRLNEITAQRNLKSFIILVGTRFSPIPFGVSTMLLASTNVKFIDFMVCLVIAISAEAPLGINLGILISESRDLFDDEDDDDENRTGDEDDFAQIQFGITTGVTVVLALAGILYGRCIWKEIQKEDSESMISKVDERIKSVLSRRSSLGRHKNDGEDKEENGSNEDKRNSITL